jgi:uncharacterized protein
MRQITRQLLVAVLLASAGGLVVSAQDRSPQYPNYPSETPPKFQAKTDSFDYVRRLEMIPMRDGIKLHTVILVPKGAKNAPILFTRTPYDADHQTSNGHSSHLGPDTTTQPR